MLKLVIRYYDPIFQEHYIETIGQNTSSHINTFLFIIMANASIVGSSLMMMFYAAAWLVFRSCGNMSRQQRKEQQIMNKHTHRHTNTLESCMCVYVCVCHQFVFYLNMALALLLLAKPAIITTTNRSPAITSSALNR